MIHGIQLLIRHVNHTEFKFLLVVRQQLAHGQDLQKKARIRYDSAKEDAYHVTFSDGNTIKFECNEQGLYVFTPKQVMLIETIAENKGRFSEIQFRRAKLAREFYHNTGAASVKTLKALIRMNYVKDNPVTVEDLNIAQAIFGADMASAPWTALV